MTGLRPSAVSPLTPPHAVRESGDYLTAGEGGENASPSQRRSTFAERLDERRK